jgi:hypothetical protein
VRHRAGAFCRVLGHRADAELREVRTGHRRYSGERALQIASLASAAKAGVAGAEVELDDYPGLHYKPAALGQPLKLQYGFAARAAGGESDIVTVDALTGAVDVRPAGLP